ncbi:TPA: hypothetical protein J1Y30_004491 [Escherichia coli]|nr:hypothetical protein [Escherichia coli]
MADFDNLFDAAIARADETIRGYRRDDDAGLWSSADLTYVITYEM